MVDQHQHTKNYRGRGQLIYYTAPNYTVDDMSSGFDVVSPSYAYDFTEVCYPIILYEPPKTDDSITERQLGGLFVPDCVVPYYDEAYGVVTEPARVTWQASFGSVTGEQTLWQSDIIMPDEWPEELSNGYTFEGGGVPSTAFNRRMIEPKELWNKISQPLGWDGNCEQPHTYHWCAGNSATIGKSTAIYYSGSQSMQIQRNGVNNPYVAWPQIPGSPQGFALRLGSRYHIRLRAKSDGNAYLNVKDADGTVLATGGTSGNWEELSDTFTMQGAGGLSNNSAYMIFEAVTSTGTEYVNIDDIEIREIGKFVHVPESTGLMSVGYLAGLNRSRR